MIGERVVVKVIRDSKLQYCWHGVVRRCWFWFWPVVTYHCWHSTQEETLSDVFNVVNSLFKES
jgi:hypothetical protein